MTARPTDVPGWLVATVVAGALFLAPVPAHAVDAVYSRVLFWRWQSGVTTLTNLAPFAVVDVLIVGLAAAVLRRGFFLVRAGRRHGATAALWEGARRLARAAALLSIVFFLMWGLNYRRVPLEATLPQSPPPSVNDLRGVVSEAGALGARLRPSITADPGSFGDLPVRLPAPLNRALASLGRPALRVPGRPKYSLILTPFFTAAGVDGMIDPFALETIVHPDLLPFERPFVVAHEWSHLAGAADEADASAIGWLACMNGDPDLAYSASLYLIVEAGAALPRAAWRDASGRLDPGVRTDLAAMAERQARRRPTVEHAAFRVYDDYLRANRVDDGVASYSRALTLILSPPLRGVLATYRGDRGRRP